MAPSWQVNTEKTQEYLRDMVRIDSVNPGLVPGGAGESEMAAWLMKTCAELELEVQVQETAPRRPNVIARWPGNERGKSLLLTGHTDVVSVENMTDAPFAGRIQDGRLYGRGAIDMKGGLAAILGAVEALGRGGFQPAGDLWLGFVTDEEYLSIGTKALVKAIHPNAAILTEPTDLTIRLAHKGFAWLTITTEGRAAHGSLYGDGIDAIAHMGRILGALEQMERETLPQRNHPLLGRPSVHASLIDGGLGLSTYPDQCRLRIEHRLLPNETQEHTLELWQKAIDRLKADDARFNATVTLDAARPGYEIEQTAPIMTTLDAAYRQLTGAEPEYTGMSAWLDSAILGRAGIPTAIFGPTGDGAHAAVEYVELDSVYQCAAVLAEAASRWTGSAT